ncbi:hypothetical protein CWI40_080150 [Ordospora colligata]|nr:hypothetical protein CWI40_080150 [Ordospora colligata]
MHSNPDETVFAEDAHGLEDRCICDDYIDSLCDSKNGMEEVKNMLESMRKMLEIGDDEGISEIVINVVGDESIYARMNELWNSGEWDMDDIFFYIVIWLRMRRFRFDMKTAENVDLALKHGLCVVEKQINKWKEICMMSILKEMKIYAENDILGWNREAILMFLWKVCIGRCGANGTTRVFALNLCMQMSMTTDLIDIRDIVLKVEEMKDFDVGEMSYGDMVILQIYWKKSFIEGVFCKDRHECVVERLFDRYMCYGEDGRYHTRLRLFEYKSIESVILCVSFVKCFIQKFNGSEDKFNAKVLSVLIRRMTEIAADAKENEYFGCLFGSTKPIVVVGTMLQSLVLLLLRKMSDKKCGNQVKAARILSRIDRLGILPGKKIKNKMIKIVKQQIARKQEEIVDACINVLYCIDPDALQIEMQRPYSMPTRRKMFEKTKNGKQSEESYRTYIELLNNGAANDVAYEIKDSNIFARVFHAIGRRRVCKFLEISMNEVKDVYVAKLAVWYSKERPDRFDVVYMSSILLDSGEDIVKSRNVVFYNYILRILINIHYKMALELRRRVFLFLRKLVFYGPYTKNSGTLINFLGYAGMEFQRRTDYFLAILGACGSVFLREYLCDYTWSINKELGLVYSLRFDPELGVMYKWKIDEILSRICDKVEVKEAAVCIELLVFLRESIEEEGRCFEFAFDVVANSCKTMICGANNANRDVCRESCMLLSAGIIARAIIPDVCIPVVFQWLPVSLEIVQMYFTSVISTIGSIIDNKVCRFKNEGCISEFKTIYEIYLSSPSKIVLVEKLIEIFDSCAIKTYYLMVQVMRFDKRMRMKVMKSVEEALYLYDLSEDRLVMKICELFCSCNISRYTDIRISDENVLFCKEPELEEIENLQLCIIK